MFDDASFSSNSSQPTSDIPTHNSAPSFSPSSYNQTTFHCSQPDITVMPNTFHFSPRKNYFPTSDPDILKQNAFSHNIFHFQGNSPPINFFTPPKPQSSFSSPSASPISPIITSSEFNISKFLRKRLPKRRLSSSLENTDNHAKRIKVNEEKMSAFMKDLNLEGQQNSNNNNNYNRNNNNGYSSLNNSCSNASMNELILETGSNNDDEFDTQASFNSKIYNNDNDNNNNINTHNDSNNNNNSNLLITDPSHNSSFHNKNTRSFCSNPSSYFISPNKHNRYFNNGTTNICNENNINKKNVSNDFNDNTLEIDNMDINFKNSNNNNNEDEDDNKNKNNGNTNDTNNNNNNNNKSSPKENEDEEEEDEEDSLWYHFEQPRSVKTLLTRISDNQRLEMMDGINFEWKRSQPPAHLPPHLVEHMMKPGLQLVLWKSPGGDVLDEVKSKSKLKDEKPLSASESSTGMETRPKQPSPLSRQPSNDMITDDDSCMDV